jgi:lipid-binding SYLF domain-containing protein
MTEKHMRRSHLILSLILTLGLASCTTTGLNSGEPAERRQAILEMRGKVLNELYSIKPDTRGQIGSAVGYAVFSNANVNLILASFGGGIGVVHDNRANNDTYMRMGEVGIGLGAGVKDFRVIFVFHDAEALERFMAVGGQADAAAKAGDLGAAVGGEAMVDNVTVYQLTQSGLALQATIKGTRYWQDGELN